MTEPTAPARTLVADVDAGVVRDRLRDLREMLARAASPGTPPEVLVASKYFAPSAIPALVEAGASLLGENRAEVLGEKQAAASATTPPVRWDFIGELQSRKAAAIAGRVDRIHTLATTSAVQKLAVQAQAGHPIPELLVQVNVAGEAAKGGVAPADLPGLLEAAGDLPVRGLMTMPPLAARPDDNRRWFAALRDLGAAHGLETLSMGTSQDAVVAAEEGATVVRIGGLFVDDGAWTALLRASA